jgi:hypothetical protein
MSNEVMQKIQEAVNDENTKKVSSQDPYTNSVLVIETEDGYVTVEERTGPEEFSDLE